MKPTQQYLGLQEAAAYLGRSERAMYHLVARRAVPFRRHGARLIFCRAELEEWLHGMPGVSVEEALAHAEEA
jgi:excisionase family DNA binding protein